MEGRLTSEDFVAVELRCVWAGRSQHLSLLKVSTSITVPRHHLGFKGFCFDLRKK